ncbi:ISAs1 family transposase, partial [Roseateles sp. GG27B]
QAVESLFTNVDAGVREGRLQENITLDKDHGRLETRRCVVTQDLSGMGVLAQAWPGLKSVIMIESTREFG